MSRRPGLATNPVVDRKPRLPNLVHAAQADPTSAPDTGSSPQVGEPAPAHSDTENRVAAQGDGAAQKTTVTKTPSSSTKLKNGKTKQSVYLLNSTIEDLKNAADALAGAPGAPRGISDLADAAIQYYIAHLQTKYNNSKPFPPRTGPLQRGPRMH